VTEVFSPSSTENGPISSPSLGRVVAQVHGARLLDGRKSWSRYLPLGMRERIGRDLEVVVCARGLSRTRIGARLPRLRRSRFVREYEKTILELARPCMREGRQRRTPDSVFRRSDRLDVPDFSLTSAALEVIVHGRILLVPMSDLELCARGRGLAKLRERRAHFLHAGGSDITFSCRHAPRPKHRAATLIDERDHYCCTQGACVTATRAVRKRSPQQVVPNAAAGPS